MEAWETITLEEICLRITDGAHNSPPSMPEGKPMGSVKDMTPYGINLETCRLISDENFETLVRQGCKPQIGDVLIAKDGATALDTVCEFRRDVDLVLLSSIAILRPNPKRVIPAFLRYYLSCSTIREYMKNAFTTGAAIPRVVLKDFKKVVIRLPPVESQKIICSVVSAYDDLIENNTRRIKILEAMAQAIYREWFVNFRFPGHKKVKIVNSSMGKIPEGWKAKRLADVCSILMGQSPKSEYYNEEGSGLPFHQGVTDFGKRYPSTRVFCTITARVADPGDILFSVRAPVGRINLADCKIVIGRGLSAIRNLEGFQCFTFYQLKEIFSKEDMIGGGTIFKAVTRGDMEGIECIYPPTDTLLRFEKVSVPISEQLAVLDRKNKNLRQTLDLLLPKLISGELDVSELDIKTEEIGK